MLNHIKIMIIVWCNDTFCKYFVEDSLKSMALKNERFVKLNEIAS